MFNNFNLLSKFKYINIKNEYECIVLYNTNIQNIELD